MSIFVHSRYIEPYTPVFVDENGRHLHALERLLPLIRRHAVAQILRAEEMDLLGKALSLAIRKHGEEKRTGGEPYIEHVIRVMEIIIETDCAVSIRSLVIALLHDIQEANYPREALNHEFWEDISADVDVLSKKSLEAYLTTTEQEDFLRHPWEKALRERRSEEYFWKLSSPLFDLVLLIVKVADRVDNLETLHGRSREQIERIIWETEKYFLTNTILTRISERLAMRLAQWYEQAQLKLTELPSGGSR